MARRKTVRLHNGQFEGLDLSPGGKFDDVKSLVAAARRIAREEGIDWRVVPYGAESASKRSRRKPIAPRNVRLVPPPGTRVTPARAWELAYALQERRDVRAAEPSFVVPADGPYRPARRRAGAGGETHSACSVGFHWAIDASFVQEAWAEPVVSGTGGKHKGEGVRIGHPDTGILLHTELLNSVLDLPSGFDFVDDDADPTDPLGSGNPGHGTSTASVIVSDFDAAGVKAVSGVAPLATLIPLRVSNKVVHFSWTRLTDAIDHAVANNAHVISMSLGGPLPSFVLHDAIEDATNAGLILVAAAGNQWPFVVFPARYDEVIAVAASNCADQRWVSSASGSDVDITAPGESVWRAETKTTGTFDVSRSSGTSYAAAQVAGVAALWLAHHGRSTLVGKYGVVDVPVVFKELLTTQGFRWPASGTWDTSNLGVGLIDAEALLQAPLPPAPHAAGMRVRGAARSVPMTELQWIASYFPLAKPEKVRAWLTGTFGVPERQLAGTLSKFGRELAFHLISDPESYAALHARLAGRRGAARVTKRRLFGSASRNFKAALA
jgi:serine protease